MPRFIFIIGLLFVNINVFACGCYSGYINTFCEDISRSTDVSSRIILIGKVSFDSEGRRIIKVQDQIVGDVKSKKITLAYNQCEIHHIRLEDKGKYLFALREHDGDYSVIGCAIAYLKVDGDEIVGKIAPGIDRYKIDELDEIIGCGTVFKSFADQIEIYPNPTTDILNISNPYSQNSFDEAQIRIFDTSGKLVGWRNNSAILNDENWIIYIEDLPSGVYFIQIINQYDSATKKVVKI